MHRSFKPVCCSIKQLKMRCIRHLKSFQTAWSLGETTDTTSSSSWGSSLLLCWFLLGCFSLLPLQLALFPLEEVRFEPAHPLRELDVDLSIGLGHRVDSLFYALGVPSAHRCLFRGVGGLVDPLPVSENDLVLVFGANDAQLAVKFLQTCQGREGKQPYVG